MSSHCWDNNTLSSLILVRSFALYHVYLLPIIGISLKSILSMNISNASISLSPLTNWLIPLLLCCFPNDVKCLNPHKFGIWWSQVKKNKSKWKPRRDGGLVIILYVCMCMGGKWWLHVQKFKYWWSHSWNNTKSIETIFQKQNFKILTLVNKSIFEL